MPYQITTGKDGKPEVVVSGFDPAKAKNPAQVAETPQQLRMAEAGLRMLPGGDVGVSAAKGAAAGVQELFRTGNIGKAQAAYQQGFVRDISVNANPITRMAVKGARDLTQSVLGNLPADEFARTGLTAPRKPGAPDAPILGIMPPLPKVQTKGMAEDIGAGLIQGGVAWFLATKGLKAAGGAAMRAPGAAAVAEAAAPVTQAARTATAFAKGAPGATGIATKVATKAAKLVLEGAPAGAIVDYAAFDPGESGRISDGATKWINTLPDPLRDAAHNLVLSAPGDTAADARWKNAVEGFMVLGPAAAGVIDRLGYAARAIGRVHQARVANRPPEPPTSGAPAAAPETPAAAQTVDVTAAPPKAPARAVDIAKQYQEMRPRQPLWEKAEVQVQGAMGFPAAQAPQSPRTLPAEAYYPRLNYSDINPGASPTLNASGKRYAKALAGQDQAAVEATQQTIQSSFKDAAAKLGIEPGPNAGSQSWSMWDIGKQLYMSANPTKSTKAYTLGNPLTDAQVQADIVDRMLGFELTQGVDPQGKRLPSWRLTEIGRKARKGAGVELSLQPAQGALAPPSSAIEQAEAELRTAVDAVDTAIAKASSTVPDELGPVPAVERGNVMPSYSQVRETAVTDIGTDPVRFQFKAAGIGKTGTTGSLKSAASYDPLFGKIVSVWRDPQTNQLFVVNGHNRLDLARRSGTKSILTWEIDAATAEEARAIGAMENIAEGQGTPWDAAKIMRDMGINAEEMVRRNIDVTKGVAEKGVALSRLPQDVFEQGVTGKLTLDKAVALGSEKLDDAVVRDVAAAAVKSGWSAEKILQAMQEAKFAQTSGPSGGGVLPGFESMFETSNFGTMLDVRTEAFKALREEMVALTSVAREGRKGILESAGNVVNVAGSQAAKGQAQAAVDVFNRVTGYTGPVRDLLNEMAGQVGGKRTAKAVVTENLGRLKAAIEDEMKGPRLPLEQAAPAPSVPSAGTPAAAAPTAELTREAVRRIMPDKLPDALRADPGLTEATKKLMIDTVRRIAGDDIAITFENGIVLKPGSKAHGTEGQLRQIGGGYSYKGIGDPIEEAIAFHEMGLLAKDGQSAVDYTKDKLEVAAHEAFHAAQLRYMSSAQLKVLDTAFAKLKLFFAARNMRARAGGARPRPIETTAQAFESFDQAAQAGVSPGAVILGMSPDDVKFFTNVDPKNPLLKSMGASDRVILSGAKTILAGVKLVDDMFDYMEKLYNAMRGRGWTSIRSIFEEAASGKLKETPGMVNAKSDLAFSDPKEWAQRVNELNRLGAPGFKYDIEFAKSEGLLSERSTLASEGPVEPQGPRPVDPPPGPENNDDWVRRFAQELERNREALIRGDITMEDLMANNFQKVQSPSGNTRYATASEDLVSGYDAMTKVLPGRQIQSGFGLFSAEETATFVQSWYTRHGADQELVTNGLMPLIRGFNEYQVGDLNRAMALADKKQVEASMEAAMWLNSANAEGVNQSERLARLVTAANAARTMHTAVMKVTRPWGQLGREMQMPRDYVIPPATGVREAVAPPAPEPLVAAAIPDVQSLDVGDEIVREIEIETARPIEETFSDDLREAVAGGEITPKAQAEADTLAQTLVSAGAEPSMREKTWGSFDVLRSTSSGDLGPLLMLRTNNLISSGVTANTNFINGMFNLARLPLSQVAGAVATGELKRAMYSMMMFQQYWMNLSNAFRVAGHSLKAGRSLMNMDVSTLDWMDRAAAKDAQGELLGGPDAKTGWTINTVNMSAEMAKKPLGMTINALWQVLGTGASRLAIGIDTFNSTLAGYAYEHVRHLPRGMDLATERGMAEFSSEAWRFAQEYANARTQATMRDAVINGKNLADVAMESPHAKDFMNAVNFTDDVWSEMQTRSLSQGISIGESQGLKGKELTDFAQKYVDEGQAQHRLANFAMNGPVPFGRLGSLPGEAMATLSQAKLVGPIFKFIQPFQRVPSNIIKSAMRGTPAAVFVDTFWRDIVSEDAFTRDRAIGEVALGSAVLSLVAMGSAMGYVRFNGGGPLDPAAKEKWSTIEGRMPYSVQVWDEAAGKWSVPTSMQAVEPYATLFGAIGDYTDIANSLSTEQRNRLGSSLVMTLARASTSGVLNKTYFQGFNEVYEAMFNPSKIMTGPAQRDPLARFMSRIAASMVPYSSALRAARRETDPIARTVDPSDVGGLMGFWQETFDEIRNAVPGWSNELPARRDWINGAPILTMGIMGGEVIPPEMPWLQAAMQFTPLAAFRQGRQSLGPVHEEMGMLSGKGTNFMGPRAADFGPEMRLTPGELEDYITTFATVKDQYGNTFEQAALQLIQSAQYQSWPVDGPSSRDVSLRAAAIQAEIQVFKKLAKEQYKVSTPKGQLIAAEEAAAEGRKLEANYIRQYGVDNNPQPAQAGGAWSPTPR